MHYTFHQLRVFLEVIKNKSITEAAKQMHMTQPALSIQLKNFQHQFDLPLIEVINKKLYVTDFGYEIARIAENVLTEADAIKFKTREYKGLVTGNLTIASASTGKYVIPYFLSEFINQNKGIDLILDVTNKTSVISKLVNNQIDFAFVSTVPNDLIVNEEPIIENKLFLVSNTPKLEETQHIIFREKGSATREVMENYFNKKARRKSLELTSNEAVKQAVIAGVGYSIIPLIGLKNELKSKQLFIIKSKGLPIINKWKLIWLNDKKLSPVAKAYLDYLSSNKEEIIRKYFKWYQDYSVKAG